MAVQSFNRPEPRVEAVIFDMDGVVTDTAVVHASAWKALFDEVMPALAPDARPFDAITDYRATIDGRPREDGVRAFLASRGITLPEGDDVDDDESTGVVPPGELTVQSLAARKQHFFDRSLEENGVKVFPDALTLLNRLRAKNTPTALVTSSRNSAKVLEAGKVAHYFDVIFDGNDARELGLPGKPEPDTFLEAARQLKVLPDQAAVLEDANAGVAAAAAGNFGWVVGVARHGSPDALRAAGAHIVATDLSNLDTRLDKHHPGWAAGESHSDPWRLHYEGYDPAAEPLRETLCTLGNGYWATRGAAPESSEGAVHYPGTYMAGVYNRLKTDIGGRVVEDEHLVNAPNWLPLTFRIYDEKRPSKRAAAAAILSGRRPAKINDNGWFDIDTADLLDYEQTLDLRRAVYSRRFRVRDPQGRITEITQQRFVSQDQEHVAGLEVTFLPENWSGTLEVRSGLEGRVANRNVAEYRLLADVHLVPRNVQAVDNETMLLEVATNQSNIRMATAARTRVRAGAELVDVPRSVTTDPAGWIAQVLSIPVTEGEAVTVEKTVVAYSSRDRAIASAALSATTWISRLPDLPALLTNHEESWREVWNEFTVLIATDERQQLALNINTFHVLQSVAGVTVDLDAGLPARGLHGEGYRGHIFWDEMYIYPMLTMHRPEISRALIGYRYRRLDEARAAARAEGHRGAMFPWQSGVDGREETPTELFNVRNEEWMPDNSHRQRHVGLAIAYSAWQMYEWTGDLDFLNEQGAELLIEVSRFFESLATYDEDANRFDIEGVMGPDEFHDGYPGTPGSGLRNNSYTNVMASWVMQRAADAVDLLRPRYADTFWKRVRVRPGEVDRWRRVASRLRVPFHADGIISQFDGYENLKEFDWEGYRAKYGSIGRLDLILAAEGDATNNYRLSKQPDVLMLLYLFSAHELKAQLGFMGYEFDTDTIPRTIEFYRERSTHGSTLSNVVHSWVEARMDRARSWEFLVQALESDLADIQGGTTRIGVHLGAMAGSVDMVTRCYTGLEAKDGKLMFDPALPPELTQIDFSVMFQQQLIRVTVDSSRLRLKVHEGGIAPIPVQVEGIDAVLLPGETRDFSHNDD